MALDKSHFELFLVEASEGRLFTRGLLNEISMQATETDLDHLSMYLVDLSCAVKEIKARTAQQVILPEPPPYFALEGLCASIASSSFHSARALNLHIDCKNASAFKSINIARKTDLKIFRQFQINYITIHYWQTIHNIIRLLLSVDRSELAEKYFREALSLIQFQAKSCRGELSLLLQTVGIQIFSHFCKYSMSQKKDVSKRVVPVKLSVVENHFDANLSIWNMVCERDKKIVNRMVLYENYYLCEDLAKIFVND